MEEILRTTDPVRLSFALSLLREAGLDPFVADQFISAIEGSIGAFPRRVLVPSDQVARAKAALKPLDEADGL